MLGLFYFPRLSRVLSCKGLTDVLLVNQTSNTLQNLCLDFATLGDLKIVERPTVYTIAPHGFQSIKATIKVSSTETGVIFGSILWEGPDLSEQAVILSDIHVDIMDYIKPAFCTEAQARTRVFVPVRRWRSAQCYYRSSAACGPSSNGRTASMCPRRCRT
jgi:vesicle coat complex subunit